MRPPARILALAPMLALATIATLPHPASARTSAASTPTSAAAPRTSAASASASATSARTSAGKQAAAVTVEDLASVPQLGAPVLSPDGKSFVIVRDGQLHIVPADGGWPSPLTTTPAPKSQPAWSPDSKTIAFVSEGSIWTVPAAGGPPRRLTDSRAGAGDPRNAADRAPHLEPEYGRSITSTQDIVLDKP